MIDARQAADSLAMKLSKYFVPYETNGTALLA
jgi:hypothetical protein